MSAFRYFLTEAAASLWRGRRSAFLAILTIGVGLFVLGAFLIVNVNLQRLAARWGEAAEFAVFLRDDATPEGREAIERMVASSGLAAGYRYVSKEEAAERFRRDFPDLGAVTTRLERSPFPASIEVRLRPEAPSAETALDTLARTLSSHAAVSDVRYDRRWLSRLHGLVGFVRTAGIVLVSLLALASALTVASVVRLAAHARRDEIEIMQLVGAPLAYVRGPLVFEGVLQGGAGALLAIAALAGLTGTASARYGPVIAEAVGTGSVILLPVELCAVLALGGMLLGCVGGLVVARDVR